MACDALLRIRRGSTLAVTLWVIIALTGVVLVLGHSVRVETIAVANRTGRVQTDAAERGAEQWLLSVVDNEVATPGSSAQIVMEQRLIGDCYIWILTPDPQNPQQYKFGLTDEAGKLDLNTATSDMLMLLPGMTQDVVDSILYWRDPTATNPGQAADTNFYLNPANHPDTPEAYSAKNAPFESVDELRLIRGINDDLLFGPDRNHNAVIDDRELTTPGVALDSSNNTGRGFYPFVTAWGVQATATATTSTGTRLVDLNAITAPVGNRPNNSANSLRTLLQNSGVGGNINNIITATQQARRFRSFRSVFDWSFTVGVNQSDLSKIFTQLTANPVTAAPATSPTTRAAGNATPRVAKINVNTASHEVLLCLPGLTESDVQQILAQRPDPTTAATTPGDLSWLVGALTPEKLGGTSAAVPGIGGYITGTTKVYSADVVAVSPDGRSFKRARIVIDARATPAKIIYRRDLTNAGWPLATDIRDALRSGYGLGPAPTTPQSSNSLRVSANQRGNLGS